MNSSRGRGHLEVRSKNEEWEKQTLEHGHHQFGIMNTFRFLVTLTVVCLILSVAGCAHVPATSNQSGRTQPFILGADITFLFEDEAASLISTPHL
jgi:hypothetical protein